ncbi:MAG: hydroxymethylglutaryl-CoA lyase [Solirubrobacteraceae bacterium]
MRVSLCDVAPRDGLQNDAATLAPDLRAQLCVRLAGAGLVRVEAASFVNPERVPQMAGAEEVFAALAAERGGDTVYAALALNLPGAQRAVAAGADEIHLAYPLTDSFAQRNQGMTVSQAAGVAEQMIVAGHEAGVRVTATLAASFGCPFEGRVDPGVVLAHAERMAAAGADELMLADTIGVGVPAQVRRLLPGARSAMGERPVGLHLHNTRNTGYANALAGLEHGATSFDASLGGLGGCPFAPRATGNIATEDLVYLLEGEGVQSGVSLDGLIDAAHWLAAVLGRELPGLVYKAGAIS